MRRLLIVLLPLAASLCACREKARTEQDPAVPEERAASTEPPAPAPPETAAARKQPEATAEPAPDKPATRIRDLAPEPPKAMPGAALPELNTARPPLPPPARGEQAVSSALPGPERAKAAAERVRPELEKALAAKGLRFGDPVFLRAFKEEGQVELWVRNRDTKNFEIFRTWEVAKQSGQLGPKLAEGDGQVPEGFYHVPPSAMKPDSTFHLAFNIGYPNDYDQGHGRTGSFIMIHGNCVSIGCLAMTDPKIEEIYTLCAAALKNGQPYFRVNLFPFRMTPERLARERYNEWFDFWTNLKEGYDFFERSHVPPEADVKDGRYVFK
jgi:murein L,D-transpeptidase YafK